MTAATGKRSPFAQRLLHSLDYLFVLRPTLFYPVWTVSLAGFWSAERAAAGLPWHTLHWPHQGFTPEDAIAIGLLTLVMGACFLLNQITDIESDRLNNKLYLVASGAVTLRGAWSETALLLAAGLGGLLWLSRPLALIALLAFLVTGWAYSCRPLYGKDRPWAGLLINLAGAGLIYLFGWLMAAPASWRIGLSALPYIAGIGAVYLLTTIPDRPGDAAAHKITLAVHWGEKRIYGAALAAGTIGVLAALPAREGVALTATLLTWPFFFSAWRRQTVDSALRANKFATLVLSFLICWRLPAYLVLLILVFYFSKWYYKKRFQVHYPSLLT
ncbi:MAG TPA: UbiA family prenyltransferase [bacterium]|nr:UbiA family prenyltransferase [bacterium]